MVGWGEGHAVRGPIKTVGGVVPLTVQGGFVASHHALMLVSLVMILQVQQQSNPAAAAALLGRRRNNSSFLHRWRHDQTH